MTTIEVIIPKGGTTRAPVEPILTPNYQSIPRNQMVAWEFYTEEESIKRVEVRFVDSDAKFFPNVSPKTEFRQEVIFWKNAEDKEVKYGGQSMIWGLAPDYGLSENQSAENKYVIEGLDADDNVVARIDPYIITTKPRPRP